MYLTNQSPNKLTTQIAALLAESGLHTSLQLQAATGASQSSMSRALASLGKNADQGLLVLGRARSTRYALVRSILGRWPGTQAVFATDAKGQISRWGTLHFLAGEQLVVAAAEAFGCAESITRASLPWFMAPLKPQGFMGRLRAQQLGYASLNPEQWSLEQTLNALVSQEHDTPGALSLSENQAAPSHDAPEDLAQRGVFYDNIAQDVAQTLPAGSSAGGEQPKFVTSVDSAPGYERFVVKFSPPRGTPFGERWHDLLHTEHLALTTLAEHGFTVSRSRILESARRTYLESLRFDRVGRLGKRHVIPLSAIHAHFVAGPQQHWAATCSALAQRSLLSQQDAERVNTLRHFGRLIGNTDMHFGNLSLTPKNLAFGEPPFFTLAPVYDMLPMLWRPNEFRDELGYSNFAVPQAPLGARHSWPDAVNMAQVFWSAVADCQSVSIELRRVAATQLTAMS